MSRGSKGRDILLLRDGATLASPVEIARPVESGADCDEGAGRASSLISLKAIVVEIAAPHSVGLAMTHYG